METNGSEWKLARRFPKWPLIFSVVEASGSVVEVGLKFPNWPLGFSVVEV